MRHWWLGRWGTGMRGGGGGGWGACMGKEEWGQGWRADVGRVAQWWMLGQCVLASSGVSRWLGVSRWEALAMAAAGASGAQVAPGGCCCQPQQLHEATCASLQAVVMPAAAVAAAGPGWLVVQCKAALARQTPVCSSCRLPLCPHS